MRYWEKSCAYSIFPKNSHPTEGSPFSKCVVSIWALPERGRGVIKACQDGLEHFFYNFDRGYKGLSVWFGALFFSTFARLTGGGGLKLTTDGNPFVMV